jgi:predicted metal-dependent hydrolase
MDGDEATIHEDAFEKFNRGDFFESHELWEKLWLRAAGPRKNFYQALIQSAAALLNLKHCKSTGALSLYRKAKGRLDKLPANYAGLAIGEFRSTLATFFEAGGSTHAKAMPKLKRLRRKKTRNRSALKLNRPRRGGLRTRLAAQRRRKRTGRRPRSDALR